MKMNRSLFLLSLALLAGCSGKDAVSPDKDPVTAPPPLVEKAGLGIPEDLVTDGLKAMGYPFDKVIEYEVNGFPPGSSSTQTLTTTFEAKEDGQNIVTFNYVGEPTNLPSESYALEKDAVYGVAYGGDAIEPKMRAMNSTFAAGDKWAAKGSIQNGTLLLNTVVKVIGRQKLTVKAGEYDALVIIETGTVKRGSDPPVTFEGKGWYVDGIGFVRKTSTQTDSTGKTSNLTIEAVSIK